MSINLRQIRNIVDNYPNISLKIANNSDNRHRIYIEADEEKQYTLMKSVKFINHDVTNDMSFAYLVIQDWWSDISPMLSKQYKSRSNLDAKDALEWGKFDLYHINEIIEAVYGKQSKTINFSKRSNQKPDIKIKRKGLDARQAKVIKELCDYECRDCNVNINKAIEEMPEYRDEIIKLKDSLIHVHHREVLNFSNRNHINNLSTLCCMCHGEQKGHGHQMQAGDARGTFIIKAIRSRQGIG
jgi:hypothetical protein